MSRPQHDDPYGGYDSSPNPQQARRNDQRRYDSLPHNSPHLGSPYSQPAASHQHRAPMGGHSIDLSAEDAGDYTFDGASSHSQTPIRFATHPAPGIPVPPIPTEPIRSDKHYPNGKAGGRTPPALSRQSTGQSWANATATQDKKASVYGQLPAATRSTEMLAFAEGDFGGNNRFAKAYFKLLASNIVVRWLIYIVRANIGISETRAHLAQTPILALLWIPGIIALSGDTSAIIVGCS
jgi:hypothetical protein